MALNENYFILKNGAIIEITPDGKMLFKDQIGNIWGEATSNQKAIIEKLLESPGEFVQTYDLCSNKNVKKKLGSLIPTIMDNLDRKYGDGYRILLRSEDDITTPVKPNLSTRNTGLLSDLAGNYRCVYLDSSGHPFGAYVHIEYNDTDDISNMKAYAIFGITSDEDLNEASNVFLDSGNYEAQYHNFTKALSGREATCLWTVGDVNTYDSNLVAICLKGAGETRWNIVIDISAYMGDKRLRKEDCDFYRGGMATIIAGWSPWGTTAAFRFAMIRTSCCNRETRLIDTPAILNKLKPAYHVNLDSTVDRDFYTWIDENRPK